MGYNEVKHNTLVYLDPGLSKGGHYVRMAETISEECSKRNIQFLHYIHMDAPDDLLKNGQAIKAFEHPAHEVLDEDSVDRKDVPTFVQKFKTSRVCSWLKSFTLLWRAIRFLWNGLVRSASVIRPRNSDQERTNTVVTSFGRTCASIIEQVGARISPDSRVVFYMYGSHPKYIAELARKMSWRLRDLPQYTFFMNLLYTDETYYISGIDKDLFQREMVRCAQLLERHDPTRRIVVCADSEAYARRFQATFKRRIQVLPVPLYGSLPVAHKPDDPDGILTIGYFGYPHEANGYSLATEAYEHFIHQRDLSGIRFLMRINADFTAGAFKSHFDAFRNNTDRLHLVTSFVSSEEHYELISACDIIMIPYLREFYNQRTSGILLDAVVHGKVVIVPEGTWMSATAARFGCGRDFVSGDIESFLAALEDVIVNYRAYAASAGNGSRELGSAFSAAALVDILFNGSDKSL